VAEAEAEAEEVVEVEEVEDLEEEVAMKVLLLKLSVRRDLSLTYHLIRKCLPYSS